MEVVDMVNFWKRSLDPSNKTHWKEQRNKLCVDVNKNIWYSDFGLFSNLSDRLVSATGLVRPVILISRFDRSYLTNSTPVAYSIVLACWQTFIMNKNYSRIYFICCLVHGVNIISQWRTVLSPVVSSCKSYGTMV